MLHDVSNKFVFHYQILCQCKHHPFCLITIFPVNIHLVLFQFISIKQSLEFDYFTHYNSNCLYIIPRRKKYMYNLWPEKLQCFGYLANRFGPNTNPCGPACLILLNCDSLSANSRNCFLLAKKSELRHWLS